MKTMFVRSVEGRMLPYLDRDGRVWGGRFVGYVDRSTRSDVSVEVHVCDYYREAVARGDIAEVIDHEPKTEGTLYESAVTEPLEPVSVEVQT